MSKDNIWPSVDVDVALEKRGRDPDLALLEAWRRGDQRAAQKLLQDYYHRVRRFVLTKVPSDDVDDVVQRVLEKVHKNQEQFRADAKFKTYVTSIARYTIAEYYRRRDRQPVSPLESSVHDLGGGQLTKLVDRQQQRILLEALRRLRLDDQILLELQFWEKMTGPELAQVFGAKETTIRSRLRRARERLSLEIEHLQSDTETLSDTVTDLDEWAEQLRVEIERLRA